MTMVKLVVDDVQITSLEHLKRKFYIEFQSKNVYSSKGNGGEVYGIYFVQIGYLFTYKVMHC